MKSNKKTARIDFEDVLAYSTQKIWLEAIIALAFLLGPTIACSEDWEIRLPIVKQGAKVFRLVNDCAGVPRDLAEGKMTCVTVLLSSFEDEATSSSPGDR